MSNEQHTIKVICIDDEDVQGYVIATNRITAKVVPKSRRFAVLAIATFDLVWPYILFALEHFFKVGVIMRNHKDHVQLVVDFTSVLIYIMLADKSVFAIFVIIASIDSDGITWMYACRLYAKFCYIFISVISLISVIAIIISFPEFEWNKFQRLAGNMIIIMIRLPDTILVHALAKLE